MRAVAGEPPCSPHVASVVVSSGRAELRRAGSPEWLAAAEGALLCYEDRIRTGADGEVVLRSADGNKERLGPDGLIELARPHEQPRAEGQALARAHPADENGPAGGNASPRVNEPADRKNIVLSLFRGFIYILSRDSRELEVQTPYANGAPNGTELEAGSSAQGTSFEMVEGAIGVTYAAGARVVNAGERFSVGADGAVDSGPMTEQALLRWTHYPRIVKGTLPAPDAEPARADDVDFFVRRAAAYLELGSTDNAMAALDRARAIDGRDARIDALLAVVALVRGESDEASTRAASALQSNPASIEALLAASYVHEAFGQGTREQRARAAVRDAQRAVELDPTSGLALARLAEAQLAAGNHKAGAAAAEEATRIAPDLGNAFTVLGFALYNQRRTTEALAAFTRAIELDGMAPDPWLGRALALLREGRADEAREAVEIAVVLDPAAAAMRSYAAKIYFDEERTALSAGQLDLVERLSPDDSTAPLLRSLQQRSQSNPVEALWALGGAAERNGGIVPSGSTFALDADTATSSAAQGRLFLDLDAPALGAEAARKMLAADPTNPAAHLLRADIFSLQRFGEAAAVSESFLYQVLSPAIETPANPQRDQLLTPFARTATPRNLTAVDVDSPLSRDGVESVVSTVAGSGNTSGASGALTWQNGQAGVNVAAFRGGSDGFRENNDTDERGGSVRFKLTRSPSRGFLLDLSRTESESGDPYLRFYRDVYSRNMRLREAADVLRFGAQLDQSAFNRAHPELRSTLLISATGANVESALSTGPLRIRTDGRTESMAVRHILETPAGRLDVGFSYVSIRGDELGNFAPPTAIRQDRRSIYAYGERELSDSLTLTVGLNADVADWRGFERSELNGKLGVVWEPGLRTTLRAAVLESPPTTTATTSRSNLQPGLERTQVAGIPQVFFPDTDRSRLRAASVQHEFSDALYGGLGVRQRSSLRPFVNLAAAAQFVEATIEERASEAYLYWLPSSKLSLSAAYENDSYRTTHGDFLDYTDVESHRTIFDFNLFPGGGVSASLRATRVRQHGNFQAISNDSVVFLPGEDTFWVADAALSYRLPNRRGIVELRADNLFDESFRYQEPESDRIMLVPERSVYLTFTYMLP